MKLSAFNWAANPPQVDWSSERRAARYANSVQAATARARKSAAVLLDPKDDHRFHGGAHSRAKPQ